MLTRGSATWAPFLWKHISPKTRHFSSFKQGDEACFTKKITLQDVQAFAELSGDVNPVHTTDPQRALVHGAYLNSLVSCVMGTKLPGPGSLVVEQILNFPNKCFADDTVTVTVRIEKARKIVKVTFKCVAQPGDRTVLFGDARLVIDRTFCI